MASNNVAFVADGQKTVFPNPLAQLPGDVLVNGVSTAFTWTDGNTITFSSPPVDGAIVSMVPGTVEIVETGEEEARSEFIPDHRWVSTVLQFRRPDGSFGTGVDLKGPADISSRSNIPTRVIPFTSFRTIDGAPWKTGTSAGPGAIQDLAGTWFELDLAAGFNIVVADWFGASQAASAAANTLAIQSAINHLNAGGGGIVRFGPGVYHLAESVEGDTWFYSASQPALPIASHFGVVLRSGVHLEGVREKVTTLKLGDPTLSVITVGVLDVDGSSVSKMTVDNNWDLVTTATNNHGIMTVVSAIQGRNINFSVHDVEIKNCASYGLGLEYGDYLNNSYYNLHIHDVGDDGIDHKVRYGFASTDGTSNTATSLGTKFDNILIERFGLRPGLSPAGIDLRGPATLTNIHVRDFGNAYYPGLSALRIDGRVSGPEAAFLEGADRTTIANIFVAGNPAFECVGLKNANSDRVHVTNGHIKGCKDGVSHGGFSSPSTLGDGSIYSNITVEGCRSGNAFAVYSGSHNQFIGCTSVGEIIIFSQKAGNLVAGQVTFTPDEGFIAATVKVYKNGVLLTGGGVDYTLTGAVSVVLTVGVLLTDEIKVVTPNAVGFALASAGTSLVGCNDIETTIRKTEAGAATGSTSDIGGRSDKEVNFVSITSDIANNRVVFQASGPGADVGAYYGTKGAGGHEFRVRDLRAFRVDGVAGAANWLAAANSAAGNALTIAAAGSDANISINLTAKGTGFLAIPQLKLGPATTVAGLPAASVALQDVVRVVTDALAPAAGSAVVGGGTLRRSVICDGVAWICMF